MIRSLVLAIWALAVAAAPALADGFNRQLFDAWVSARAGDGAPVYWYSTGDVRSYPDGKLLALMEGYDTAVSFRPDPAKPVAHQYSRKFYIFRDPVTREVITSWNGAKAEPIAYPYQFITYALEGDKVRTVVEQGRAPRVQTIQGGDGLEVRMVGDTLAFTAPVFLDFPIPGTDRRYQAWENYDFLIQPKRSRVAEPHQLSWARYGPAPAFMGGGPSIMRLTTWRVERYADIPAPLRAYVEANLPDWKAPPANLADIRRLQQGATP
jgi:hypothetical protein